MTLSVTEALQYLQASRNRIGPDMDKIIRALINGDFHATALDGVTIGGTTPAAGSFTTITGSGALKVGSNSVIGSTSITPDGTLHIISGSAGAISASGIANTLVVETDTSGGITILTPNTSTGRIAFGDTDSAIVGRIDYVHSADAFLFYAAGSEIIRIGNNVTVNGSAIPASSVGSIVHFLGTAPTGSVTDGYAQYASDVTAGNAAPTFRTEGGDIIQLFEGAALTAANGGAINSGDATTDAVITANRTRIGEIEDRLQAAGLLA